MLSPRHAFPRLLMLLALLAGTAPAGSGQTVASGARPGLHCPLGAYERLAERFREGEPVVVAFLGGSNANGNTSMPEVAVDPEHGPYDISWYDKELHSFRALILEGLQETFGVVPGQVVGLNAAYGGAPVALAAWRFEQDVLEALPRLDLLVIEYVVNDTPLVELAPEEDRSIARSTLSILQQLQASHPEAAVLSMLMTMRGGYSDPQVDLQIDAAASYAAHQRFLGSYVGARVSRRRDLAILDAEDLLHNHPMPPEVGPLFLSATGEIVDKHPSPFGHAYIAQATIELIGSRMSGARSPLPDYEPFAEPLLPFPRSPRLVSPQEILDESVSSGFFVAPAEDNTPIFVGRDALYATAPGDTLEFTFEARGAFDMWVQKRYAGGLKLNAQVEIRVDDGPYLVYSAPREPGADRDLERYTIVASDLAYEPHTVHMRVLEFDNGLPFALAFHAFLREAE